MEHGQTTTISPPPAVKPADALIRRFMEYYENYSVDTIAHFDEIYTPDIEFVDPVHRIEGLLALKNYMRKMATNLSDYRILYLDVLTGEDRAYLSWEMRYRHPRIRGGELVSLPGMTRIDFTHRVYYHEDRYDVGAMLYDHLPVLGGVTRYLKRRIARQVGS